MRKFIVTVDGSKYEVEIEEVTADSAPISSPAPATVKSAAPAPKPERKPASVSSASDGTKVVSPMPGNILKIEVTAGQTVKKGDVLCILEAMKMENEIFSPKDATVAEVNCSKGASVGTGAVLFTLA